MLFKNLTFLKGSELELAKSDLFIENQRIHSFTDAASTDETVVFNAEGYLAIPTLINVIDADLDKYGYSAAVLDSLMGGRSLQETV